MTFDIGIVRVRDDGGLQRVVFRCGCEWEGNWSDNEMLRDVHPARSSKCRDEATFHEWLANDIVSKKPKYHTIDLGIAFTRRVGTTAFYVRFHCGCAGLVDWSGLPYDGWFMSPYCGRSAHAKAGRCYATYDPKRDWIRKRREYESARVERDEDEEDDDE